MGAALGELAALGIVEAAAVTLPTIFVNHDRIGVADADAAGAGTVDVSDAIDGENGVVFGGGVGGGDGRSKMV